MRPWRRSACVLLAGLVLSVSALSPMRAATLWDTNVTIAFEEAPLDEALAALSEASSIAMEIEGQIPQHLVDYVARGEPLINVIERVLFPINHLVVWRNDGVLSIVLLDNRGDLDESKLVSVDFLEERAVLPKRAADSADLPFEDDEDDQLASLEALESEELPVGATLSAEANAGELYPPADGEIAVSYADVVAEKLPIGEAPLNEEPLVPDEEGGQPLYIVGDLKAQDTSEGLAHTFHDDLVPPDDLGDEVLTVIDLDEPPADDFESDLVPPE